ncbi:unnamed protein product, partial [Ectocarpus sp. 13 AM-2016]
AAVLRSTAGGLQRHRGQRNGRHGLHHELVVGGGAHLPEGGREGRGRVGREGGVFGRALAVVWLPRALPDRVGVRPGLPGPGARQSRG